MDNNNSNNPTQTPPAAPVMPGVPTAAPAAPATGAPMSTTPTPPAMPNVPVSSPVEPSKGSSKMIWIALAIVLVIAILVVGGYLLMSNRGQADNSVTQDDKGKVITSDLKTEIEAIEETDDIDKDFVEIDADLQNL